MNEFATSGFKKTAKEVRTKQTAKKPVKTKSVQRRTADENRVSRCSSNSTLVPPASSIYPERSMNSLSEEDSEEGMLTTPLTSSIWSPEGPPVLIERHKSGAKTARRKSGSNSKGKKSGTRYFQYVD